MRLEVSRAFLTKTGNRVFLARTGFVLAWLCGGVLFSPGISAQSATPITSSGLNTQVSAPTNLPGGKIQYDITGGTRPGNGPNLFHSFGEFGVPNNNIANFRNDSALATSNILGRVTGGNPSNIFGMIKTTDFGNANLFLMNPAGILFGPNATLNVGGSVHFTTADYLRLSDGARFTAIAGAQDALLSTAPVAAFGFLSSSPAAISVQGSALSVQTGQSISLIGGDISIQSAMLEDGTSQAAHLSAPGGQIRLASVASPGEILHPTLETGPNINGQTFSTMGTLTVSGNSTIDVSADAAGTVKVRSGQLVIDDSTISADTGETNGASTAIDINVTGDITISNSTVPVLTARTTGAGDAGDIRISSANMSVTTTTTAATLTVIDSHTSGSGRAGNVSITLTGNLEVTGDPSAEVFFIDSGTIGLEGGHGGSVTIAAKNVRLQDMVISTGDLSANLLGEDAAGSGGNVTITADTLQLTTAVIDTEGILNGRGGGITISARDIQMNDFSELAVGGIEQAGPVQITADSLIVDSTQILSQTGLAPGGGIVITGKIVEFKNGSTVASQALGDAAGGDLHLTATDHLTLSDTPPAAIRPSGLFTNSLGLIGIGTLGDAGAIIISTPRLEISGGARIDSSTQTNGRAGPITITADQISISGERRTLGPEPFFFLGGRPSGIYTRTVRSRFCIGPCGDAGPISITTGSLNLDRGAEINSGTKSTGRGGDITINANTISIAGTMSDGTPSGIFSNTANPATGAGGDISLNANQVSLNNGSTISAQSTSSGNAGKISITAADRFVMRDSTVTTSTTQSDGGNITITAVNLVQLVNSEISTSVQGGAGNGGNITIDPQFVILQSGSQILANAFGGNGGNINIVAGLLLSSPDSVINASSALGVSGTITINSAISDLSGSLAPLPSGFLKTGTLFRSRCSARVAGETTSSFVLASKGGIPTEPGGTLISPLPSTNVRSARFSLSSEDVVLRVAPQFAGSSTALPPLGGTCSS